MNKNVIYVIAKHTPYFKYVHNGFKIYAKKNFADLIVLDDTYKSSHSMSPHYDKFDIFNMFNSSLYDNMLFLDSDIRILNTCPNIFELNLYAGLVPDHKSNHKLDQFNNWLVNNFNLKPINYYFNSGVMIFSKKAISDLLKYIPKNVNDISKTFNPFNDYDQIYINQYLSNIRVDVLDKKWNRVARDPEVLSNSQSPDAFFVHYLVNKIDIGTEKDKYIKFSL